MKRGQPPGRKTPLARRTGLQRAPWSRAVPPLAVVSTEVKGAATRKRIKPVSAKRAARNRERAAMADRLWPDRREGTVMCGCGRPDCSRRADDLHEPLSRARGGSITDEANARPLARECHDEVTRGPDWAYAAGLIKHDAPCCQGRAICSRYAEDGAA